MIETKISSIEPFTNIPSYLKITKVKRVISLLRHWSKFPLNISVKWKRKWKIFIQKILHTVKRYGIMDGRKTFYDGLFNYLNGTFELRFYTGKCRGLSDKCFEGRFPTSKCLNLEIERRGHWQTFLHMNVPIRF